MTHELSLLIGFIAGAMLSFWTGWQARGDSIRARGGVIGRPPLIFNEGRTVRGNGNGGPSTAKPPIVPKPQFPPPRKIREDFLP